MSAREIQPGELVDEPAPVSKSSIPLMLYTVADAIARVGLPEPDQVYVDPDNGICVRARTRADLDRWCDHIGIGYSEWDRRSQPFNGDGVPRTLTNAYGEWHGMRVNVNCCVPVDVRNAEGVAA